MESLEVIYSLFVYGIVVGAGAGCAVWMVGYGIKFLIHTMKRS